MSRVYTDTIEPRKETQDITLGTSGETISVGANSINVNTVADKGGNTLWTSDGSGNLSSVNAGLKGNLVLLDTNTFTGASSSSFTTLIDSTYDLYKFEFNAINPASDTHFRFNVSIDGGSNYNVAKTTTFFNAYVTEAGTGGTLSYFADADLAQGTGYQVLAWNVGAEADECCVGELWLFAPSTTTLYKQFTGVCQEYLIGDYSQQNFMAGYIETTSAINAIDFKMTSGNFDGKITMYGVT